MRVWIFHLDPDVEDSPLHEISVKIEEEDNEDENEDYKDISNKGKYRNFLDQKISRVRSFAKFRVFNGI